MPPIEPNQILLHYRIVAKIGEGGMGAVYRAEDTRLGREVAIKVMPDDLARDPDRRRRFEQEARAVAALKHPNIVTIYSVEESEGISFITMELLEGQSLSELIPAAGFDLARLFKLAIPAAEALSSAHEKHVTHRDLKPDNMMLDADGRLKVLDFGLAKLLEPDDSGSDMATQVLTSTPRTEEGKILGTAAYMSPEQAEGKPVDARTDIFSFGVVLFEMATGARPFQGDTAISTISSILKDSPPRVSDLKPMLPRHLGRIIGRCLEKEPAKRFQTARDIVNELENLKKEIDSGQLEAGAHSMTTSGVMPAATATPTPRRWLPWIAIGVMLLVVSVGSAWWALSRDGEAPLTLTNRGTNANAAATSAKLSKPMIAVLPFDNLGPAEDAYFAAGITDEIIGRLSGVSALGVISRTSVTQYDRSGKSMRQVGEDLGVSHVLEGTVRWARAKDGEEQVRITPRLVNVADDSQLWAETYDRKIDDIFEVQSNIAGQVIDQLGIALAGGERDALEERPTDNIEAYQAFLKAKEPIGGRTFGDWIATSVASLETATRLDPEFLEAWSDLSQWHCGLYSANWDRTETRLELAKQSMERALAIDPDHPKALMARGAYYYNGFRDYERALKDFEAVAAAVPNDVKARSAVGYIHRRQGRLSEALAELESARTLDPRDADLLSGIGEIHRGMRDWDRSIEIGRQVIELNPESEGQRFELARDALWKTGDTSRALEQWRELPANPGSQMYFIGSFALDLWDRDFDGAYDWASKMPADSPQLELARREILATIVAARDGTDAARASLEAIVTEKKKRLESEPGNAEVRQTLARIYALLGDGDAAVREGRMAVELTARDRWAGPKFEAALAEVYATLGRADDALDLAEKLLNMTYEDPLTLTHLRLGIPWDPIRDDPRFQALIAE